MKRPKSLSVALKSAPTGFRALPQLSSSQEVDREGGDDGQGIIRGASVIMRGDALGHGMFVDAVMLDQVAAALNAAGDSGIKARFSHPSESSDGMGKTLGRFKGPAVVDGDKVRADLHFIEAAHKSPDGDLADYVMSLAESDGDMFGISIVFRRDLVAEEKFIADNSVADNEGFPVFESPDDKNTGNYSHTRLHTLEAADVVDEPAANEEGLFNKGSKRREELLGRLELGDSIVAVLFEDAGLVPRGTIACDHDRDVVAKAQWDVHPERMAGFLARFCNTHGLTFSLKEKGDQGDMAELDMTSEEISALASQAAEAAATKTAESFSEKIGELENKVQSLSAKDDKKEEPKKEAPSDSLSDAEREELESLRADKEKADAELAEKAEAERIEKIVEAKMGIKTGGTPSAPDSGDDAELGKKTDADDKPKTPAESYKAKFKTASGLDYDEITKPLSERKEAQSPEERKALAEFIMSNGNLPA